MASQRQTGLYAAGEIGDGAQQGQQQGQQQEQDGSPQDRHHYHHNNHHHDQHAGVCFLFGLPAELIEMIAGQLEKEDLIALSLTCKALSKHTRDLLFRAPVLNRTSFCRFALTVLNNRAELAPLVRSLTVTGDHVAPRPRAEQVNRRYEACRAPSRTIGMQAGAALMLDSELARPEAERCIVFQSPRIQQAGYTFSCRDLAGRVDVWGPPEHYLHDLDAELHSLLHHLPNLRRLDVDHRYEAQTRDATIAKRVQQRSTVVEHCLAKAAAQVVAADGTSSSSSSSSSTAPRSANVPAHVPSASAVNVNANIPATSNSSSSNVAAPFVTADGTSSSFSSSTALPSANVPANVPSASAVNVNANIPATNSSSSVAVSAATGDIADLAVPAINAAATTAVAPLNAAVVAANITVPVHPRRILQGLRSLHLRDNRLELLDEPLFAQAVLIPTLVSLVLDGYCFTAADLSYFVASEHDAVAQRLAVRSLGMFECTLLEHELRALLTCCPALDSLAWSARSLGRTRRRLVRGQTWPAYLSPEAVTRAVRTSAVRLRALELRAFEPASQWKRNWRRAPAAGPSLQRCADMLDDLDGQQLDLARQLPTLETLTVSALVLVGRIRHDRPEAAEPLAARLLPILATAGDGDGASISISTSISASTSTSTTTTGTATRARFGPNARLRRLTLHYDEILSGPLAQGWHQRTLAPQPPNWHALGEARTAAIRRDGALFARWIAHLQHFLARDCAALGLFPALADVVVFAPAAWGFMYDAAAYGVPPAAAADDDNDNDNENDDDGSHPQPGPCPFPFGLVCPPGVRLRVLAASWPRAAPGLVVPGARLRCRSPPRAHCWLDWDRRPGAPARRTVTPLSWDDAVAMARDRVVEDPYRG